MSAAEEGGPRASPKDGTTTRGGGNEDAKIMEEGEPPPPSSPSSSPSPSRQSLDLLDLSNGRRNLHAHFDPYSGAAGDMMLSSLLDASPHPQLLLRYVINAIKNGVPELRGEFDIQMERVWRGGMGSIAATKVDVWSKYGHRAAPVPGKGRGADAGGDGGGKGGGSAASDEDLGHDHEHSHEHSHEHGHDQYHSHSHSHGHEHSHEHSHSHGHGHNHSHGDGDGDGDGDGGPLRSLPQIRSLLLSSSPLYIPPHVANLTLRIFTSLAIAEARTHGADSVDEVHFHEVGAIDSIVDVLGTVLALDVLGVDLGADLGQPTSGSTGVIDEGGEKGGGGRSPRVSTGPLPTGRGSVQTQHGQLPVPAFATMRLMVGMETCPGPGAGAGGGGAMTGELVTPTGAALLRVLTGVDDDASTRNGSGNGGGSRYRGRMPPFTPRYVGVGAGTKDFVGWPNVMRVIIGDEVVGNDRRRNVSGSVSDGGGGGCGEDDLKSVGGAAAGASAGVAAEARASSGASGAEEAGSSSPAVRLAPPTGADAAAAAAIASTATTTTNSSSSNNNKGSSNHKKWRTDRLTHLIANLDDMSPERLSYASELLLESPGTVDVWTQPIVMKKGRVGHALHCLCRDDDMDDGGRESSSRVLELIFRHTTTLGIRIERNVERASLGRRFVTVRVPPDDDGVDVKVGYLLGRGGGGGDEEEEGEGGEVVSVKAEFDHCRAISERTGVPIEAVARCAEAKAREELGIT